MSERDEILPRRAALRAAFGDALYDALLAVLFRHDPAGINFGSNTDEYEPEVDTILPRLERCASMEDARCMVFAEFTHWFGDDFDERRATVCVEAVWTVWRQMMSNGYPPST